MLLLAKVDMVSEAKYYKKNIVESFYSNGSKMVFALLTEVVIGHLVIISINIKKAYFEKMFTRTFYSHGSGFFYRPNDFLYGLICINF